jgi:trk system potassium uptake protein TrkH
MKFRIVFRIIGFLLLFLAIALIPPMIVSLIYGEDQWVAFLQSMAICGLLGSFGFVLKKDRGDVRPKEGFAVVTFGWIALSAFGALPYYISGEIPSYTDAFFETISGFTTTGASILTDIESLSYGMLFWRNLTNWLGGMGIIVLTIAILPFLGVGGMQLFKAESPGPTAERLRPRVTQTAKLLWLVYAGFTVLIVVLLLFGGMNLFDATCHAFSTIATAGHSPKNASIGHYNSYYIDYVIIIFMAVAAINFSLHYRLITGDYKQFFKNKEMQFLFWIVGIASLIIILDQYFNTSKHIADIIDHTLFQVLAIISTTGLGNNDYELWPAISQKVILVIMFIGGSAGSTSGGIKMIRILIILKFILSEISRMLHPNAIVNVRIGDQVIDRSVILNIAGFFMMFCLLAVFGTLAMSMLGMDFLTSFTAVITTINNVGPGFGLVGPTDNYAFVPDLGKWLLSFFMLVGRLEIFTVLILFAPSFWKK